MVQKVLSNCLRPIIEAEERLRRRKVISVVFGLGTLGFALFLYLAAQHNWWSTQTIVTFLGVLAAMSLGGFLWSASRRPDLRQLARKVEHSHPDLKAALLTAMDQEPDESGRLGYLQSKLLGDVAEHAVKNRWVRQVSDRQLKRAGFLQFVAIISFFVSAWMLMGEVPERGLLTSRDSKKEKEIEKVAEETVEVSVTPGDVELEKGSRLVVTAQFSGKVPSRASLILFEKGNPEQVRGTVPMSPGLDDESFSGLIDRIDESAEYRVSYESGQSDDFDIEIFEYPQLVRADATITPPDYTGMPVKTIEDTRKVSLMEGSDLEWRVKVNKPVAAAELFGEDESIVPLVVSEEDPTTLIARHQPMLSQKYRLHLVDDKNRANKRPPWFTVNVKENLPPKLEFTFPQRDIELSKLQELAVNAKVWDDIGVVRAGVSYEYGDKTREIVLAENEMEGGAHHDLDSLLSVEELGAEPRDLISYYLWAEDLGTDGEVRRSESDLFFAEVRHFEDIFREGQAAGGGGGSGGQQAERLLNLQKDVINATWKLIRRHRMGRSVAEMKEDLEVVKESQGIVASQAQQVISEQEDPELKKLFQEALEFMEEAVLNFELVLKKENGEDIQLAYNSSKKAFEKLIQARAREHRITQSMSQSQGQGQQMQQQLSNLELKQKELKYKEESEAMNEQQGAMQEENLEVLNRLKELARRQEAVAEKIKELENALREAETEEERNEIERQLKRLKEEQEQLMRELDDLTQTMDSEENRAEMAEERERLEEARENLRETSEKLEEGKLSDAANAATRAQRELEEVQEDFRKRTSRQFSEEMKGMRNAVREMAEKQQQISEELEEGSPREEGADPFSNSVEDQMKGLDLSRQLNEQRQDLRKLLEEMKRLSEESEVSEPLLSDALYEAVRNAMVNGVEESLEEAEDYVRFNRAEQARKPEQAAARGIEGLKDEVEAAAEKVLGSEADALRLARSEVDRLIEEAEAEAERLGEGEAKEGEPGAGEPMELASNERRQGEGRMPGSETDSPEQGKGGSQPREGNQGDTPQSPGNGKEEGREQTEGAGGERPGEESTPQEGNRGEKGKGEKGDMPGNQQPGEDSEEGQQGQGQEGQQGQGQQGQQGQGQQGQQGQGQQGQQGQGQQGQQGEGQQGQQGQGQEGQQGQGQEGQQGQGQQGQQGQGQEGQQGQGQQGQQGQGQQGQQGQGQQGGLRTRPMLSGGGNDGRRSTGSNFGGDDRGGGLPQGGAENGQPLFFNQSREERRQGPISGDDFRDWSDRLSSVEEMLDQDDLRNNVAKVLDDARAMRIDYQRNNNPPGAATIQNRITNPLLELRGRISEELARLNKDNPLAPIDRDPVPGEFRELVKKYYEELGSGR